MGNVIGHCSHVARQRQTLNADPAKMELNQRLRGIHDPAADVKARFDGIKIDTLCNEIVLSYLFSD